jgi:S-ribosylhomocysteine lyase LuxS involved in autoinducer biosynthesis
MLTARSKRSPVVDIAETNVNDLIDGRQSAISGANREQCGGILLTNMASDFASTLS